MIKITKSISIDEKEIQEDFIRSSGPGGQNVNKLSTAVQLRFNVDYSPSIPDKVKNRLRSLAGSRLNSSGDLIITAQRFRTQERNRQDALDRLVDLIRQATIEPKKRKTTKPSKASEKKRLEAKQQRGKLKQMRKSPDREDD